MHHTSPRNATLVLDPYGGGADPQRLFCLTRPVSLIAFRGEVRPVQVMTYASCAGVPQHVERGPIVAEKLIIWPHPTY